MPARSVRPEEDAWRALEPRRPAREYGFVRPDDELWITTIANTITVGTFTAVPIGWVEILPLWGGTPMYRRIAQANATANRTPDSDGPLRIDTAGWIVDGGVTFGNVTATAFKRGMLFSTLRIRRPASDRHWTTLAAGYLTGDRPNVPIGRIEDSGPGGGEGFIRTVTGTDPGASGEEVLQTVPANALWRLLAFGVVLVTSADAATRVPRLVCDDGTTANRLFMLGGANQAASLTRTHLWTRSSNSIADDSANLFADTDTLLVHATIPEGFLSEGYRLRTSTIAIDTTGPAFDNYAAPIFQVEEWLKL